MSRSMLRILFAVLLVPAFGMTQATAQAPAAPAAPSAAAIAPAKIAWIDLEQAIISCEEGAKLLGDVQKYVESKNAELETLRKEFDTLRNQLSMQGSKLTDEARLELEDKTDAKNTQLERFQQDTQKEINAQRDRTTNYIGKRMLPVIAKVAKEKGLSAAQFLQSARDAWVDPSLIITDEVIKAYNQTYPVAAPKAPAAPAKKP